MSIESPSPQQDTLYVHRIGTHSPDAVLTHSKVITRSSGSILSHDIGTTFFSGTKVEAEPDTSAVLMPTYHDIWAAEQTRVDAHERRQSPTRIENGSLDEFIDSGKAYIDELLRVIGTRALLTSHLKLAERKVPAMSEQESGLLVPNPNADTFTSFVATPDEIDAMKRIQDYANTRFAVHNHQLDSDDSVPTGNYL